MDYVVKYSRRRTVAFVVKDGILTVKAPYGVSKALIESLILKHEERIRARLEDERKKKAFHASLSKNDISRIKREAEIYFDEKLKEYAPRLGVEYKSFKITSAEYRFGSASSRGTICFSYRLMLYPESAREYVVVHELAHLREMNHSLRFYKIVESVMPDWRERRELLKTPYYK